jgi:hypothetical protein
MMVQGIAGTNQPKPQIMTARSGPPGWHRTRRRAGQGGLNMVSRKRITHGSRWPPPTICRKITVCSWCGPTGSVCHRSTRSGGAVGPARSDECGCLVEDHPTIVIFSCPFSWHAACSVIPHGAGFRLIPSQYAPRARLRCFGIGFDRPAPGEQRIVRALHDAQMVGGSTSSCHESRSWPRSLDDIAQMTQSGAGWPRSSSNSSKRACSPSRPCDTSSLAGLDHPKAPAPHRASQHQLLEGNSSRFPVW